MPEDCVFFYCLVVDCTLRTGCNFEVDLQYWGELLDIVKMYVELIQTQLCRQSI